MGVLGPDTLHCRSYDGINAENYAGFLKPAYKIYGKFVPFPDSAAYHKSGDTERVPRGHGRQDRDLQLFPAVHARIKSVEWKQRSFRRTTGNCIHADVN